VDTPAHPPAPAPATQPPALALRWGAEALREQLEPLLPGIEVEIVARVDSTNSRLLARAREAGGDRHAPISHPGGPGHGASLAEGGATPTGRCAADLTPCLLVAEEQTAGRGRLGRGWSSAATRSLTFSLGLPLAPVQWDGLSLAVGVALAEALETRPAAPRLALKWPNDLWLRDDAAAPVLGRKLGGVLIETVSVGRHRMVVVGVGLNVLPRAEVAAAGPPLAHGYACLQELDAAAAAPATLATVAVPLAQALKRFERGGFAPFVQGFAARDLLLGQAVVVHGGSALEGVAAGVDEQGALRLRTAAGEHRIVSGEASVRLAHTAGAR
jgi:BirA family biotin operon repressor/biotin-[acetyl-CoA-carboxylase] ligase